jgi:hypothetical protein
LIPSVSSWASHFSEENRFPCGIAISSWSCQPSVFSSDVQESCTVRENGAGALVLPELWSLN